MTISNTTFLKNILPEDTIYSLSKKIGQNHKLTRAYLYHSNLNPEVLYNLESLLKFKNKSFTIPSREQLFLKNSVLAHSLYLCEGWHTENTNNLSFTNQNETLVEMFSNCLFDTYGYDKPIIINITFNRNCLNSQTKKESYINFFADKQKYNIIFGHDTQRKNAIIRAKAGGKYLARFFIDNAYLILSEINKAD